MTDLFFADLVCETSETMGTGPVVLAGATPGHRRFADAVPTGARFHYAISGISFESEWEVGEGELDGEGRLVRTPLSSSQAGAAVDFRAGAKTVALVVAAQWFADRDDRSAHQHATADVAGLDAALAGKQPAGDYAAAGHEHSQYWQRNGSGNYSTTGRVGIGTGTPQVPLHVVGETRAEGPLTLTSAPGSYTELTFRKGETVSPDAVHWSWSHRENGRDIWLYGYDGATFRNFIQCSWATNSLNFDAKVCIGYSVPAHALDVTLGNIRTTGAVLAQGIAQPWSGSGCFLDYQPGGAGRIGAYDNDGAATLPLDLVATRLAPSVDAGGTLGSAGQRFADLHLVNAPIVTSDAEAKHWLGSAPAGAELAAQRIIAEIGRYQWRDSVDSKGEDGARIHWGVRAQRVADILTEEGLEAATGDGAPSFRNAFLCFDRIEGDADDSAAGRFGLRTDQLLFFLIAAQSRTIASLEARLAALELQP